ncbi:MAG: hypothetical protein H0U27_13475 [Nitrosopumilus sp.]|nr:hypothetical protein [Nitrosopumilus sp.]MBA3971466.1 hypothetical protein [Bacteroidota bacterium]
MDRTDKSAISGYCFDNVEANQTDHYIYKIYYKNGTYLSFDLTDNKTKIRKIECGKYWSTNKNVRDYEYSSAKAVFDKRKEHLIDFLQVSFDSEYGDQHELDLSEPNIKTLNDFLKILLDCGWTETYYKYQDDCYKVQIEYNFAGACLRQRNNSYAFCRTRFADIW